MGLENCVESKVLISGSPRSRHVVASIVDAAAYVCIHSCMNGEKKLHRMQNLTWLCVNIEFKRRNKNQQRIAGWICKEYFWKVTHKYWTSHVVSRYDLGHIRWLGLFSVLF